MKWPSRVRYRYFTVPSTERISSAGACAPMQQVAASFSRAFSDRLVICEKSVTHLP